MKILLDCLEVRDSFKEFLDHFHSVSGDRAISVLAMIRSPHNNVDVGFLNLDRLRDRKSDRTPATTSTNYGPNPSQLKDFADFSLARHRSLTITEP